MPPVVFPPGDTTLLDSFTRADGNVWADAGATLWSDVALDGSASKLRVSSNALVTTAEGGGMTLEDEADAIRVFTVTTTAVSGYLQFFFRMVDGDGYAMTMQGGNWTLYSVTGGTSFSLVDVHATTGTLTDGIRVGIRWEADEMSVHLGTARYLDPTPVWETSGLSNTGSGAMGFQLSSNAWVIDDYSEGSFDYPTSGVTLYVDPDNVAASDNYNRTQASNPATPLATIETAAFLVRADTTWADEILVKRCLTADLGDDNDPHLYPTLEHRLSNSATAWPLADNTGNETIVLRGDTTDSTGDLDNLPKIKKFSYRHLKNWTIQDLQFGYDVSSEADRIGGTGWDYLTWGIGEKIEDITYERCLFTGGALIVGNWTGTFTVHQCRIHAPLSPGQFGVADGEGFGFSGTAGDGSVDIAHGHIVFSECHFDGVRGNDAIRADGCFADGVTWDDDFDFHCTDTIFQNVVEQNVIYHTDSMQLVSVPRATVQRCAFIGCADALMLVDVHNGVITIENCLIAGPLSPTPIQVAGTDHLIIRHCTIDVKETTPQDASLGFVDKFNLETPTLIECVNNIFGGFYMPNTGIEDYFHPDSVIENNIVTSNPGWVTPYGTNLPGLMEFGESARLEAIPNEVVLEHEDTDTVPMDRTWELANTPITSPGIGQGQATDIPSDYFGRAYASPPDVGCFQSDPGTPVTPAPRGPYVLSRDPGVGETGVDPAIDVTVVLFPVPGAEVDPLTVTTGTAYISDVTGETIPGLVTLGPLDENGEQTLTIEPTLPGGAEGTLYPLVTYTVHLTGAIEDDADSPLAATTWTFRVAGPDGPAISAPETADVFEDDPPQNFAVTSRQGDRTVVSRTEVRFPAETELTVWEVDEDRQITGSPVSTGVVSADFSVAFTGLTVGRYYVMGPRSTGPFTLFRVLE